ncbi:MAG: TIM barrel protein [Firmicutes bacterium]|nr:TIM barrel protein [Bacillota bacterium]
MKYIVNLSNEKSQLAWFRNDSKQIESFLDRNHLDGIELFYHGREGLEVIPRQRVYGMHLRFWPMWLDFWQGNEEELLRQFDSHENIQHFYGGLSRKCLVDYYQEEFRLAEELSAEYVVFHVSHVQMEHIYTRQYCYNDWDVMKATAELVNEAFGSVDRGVTILFENLWWPGLTFLDPQKTESFLQLINYPRKGFMLDTGHLMITGCNVRDEESGFAYMLEKLTALGELKKYIKGIHLNKSLAGEYLQQCHKDKEEKLRSLSNVWDRYMEARKHIMQIDQHLPFEQPGIKKVVEFVAPDYLVHEFVADNLNSIERSIEIQNKALGRTN